MSASRRRSQIRTAAYIGGGGHGSGSTSPAVVVANPLVEVPELESDSDYELDLKAYKPPRGSFVEGAGGVAAGPEHGWRHKLHHAMETNAFQFSVIGLVLLDLVVTLVQIMLDLDAIVLGDGHALPGVLHTVSVVILAIFVAEVLLHIVAVGICAWIRLKWDVFDGIVVFVSFTFDVAFTGVGIGASLLIALRLWRVTRVIHGFVHTTHLRAEARVQKWKARLARAKRRLAKERRKNATLQQEVDALWARLGGRPVSSAPPAARPAPPGHTSVGAPRPPGSSKAAAPGTGAAAV